MSSYLLSLFWGMPPNAAHHTIAGLQSHFRCQSDTAGITSF